MSTSVTRRYHFEAAHWLPGVPETHKCHRVHGHNYQVEVTVRGQVDERGFVIDFFELDEAVGPLIAQVDHRTLNDIAGLQNPTAELIAEWFRSRLITTGRFPPGAVIERVRVYETMDCWADVTR